MSFLVYILILSTISSLSTGSYLYGIIRNASIKIPFDVNNDHGLQLATESCNQCLCNAFSNPKVVLLTCAENEPMNFTCQLYYFMPKRDEIEYPIYNTSIYLIQTNQTFEEKDDCCNTTKLIEKIKEQLLSNKTTIVGIPLRTLAEGDNNTIITVISDGSSSERKLLKFDKSSEFKSIPLQSPTSLKSAGYFDKKYYFGIDVGTIRVYDEYMNRSLYTITNINDDINTIRFLKNTQEMLVGAADAGVFICRKNTEGILGNCSEISSSYTGEQLHAIGVVNDNAFYAGWDAPNQNLRLFKRDQNNTWTTNTNDTIPHTEKTSDIIIDDCQRIWAVVSGSDEIFIYSQNKTLLEKINVGGSSLFNLMILDNYTLIMAHESNTGLTRIQPSLNCRPIR